MKPENGTTIKKKNFFFFRISLPEARSFPTAHTLMSRLMIMRAQNTDLLTFPAITTSHSKRHQTILSWTYAACAKVRVVVPSAQTVQHSIPRSTAIASTPATRPVRILIVELTVVSVRWRDFKNGKTYFTLIKTSYHPNGEICTVTTHKTRILSLFISFYTKTLRTKKVCSASLVNTKIQNLILLKKVIN